MGTPMVAAVIPTRNEAGNVDVLVPELLATGLVARVLVLDDDSTDGTLERLDRIAAADPRLRVVRRSGPRGYGRASLEGMRLALVEGADLVAQLDGDRSHDPCYLREMIRSAGQADLVLGSRYVQGVSVVNWSLSRLLLSTAANRYVRLLAGLGVQDCTTGYRVWRRSLLERLDLGSIRSEGYSFLVETLFRVTRLEARIAEVPIVFIERRLGRSKLSGRVFLESAGMPWRLLARRLVGAIR